MLRVALPPCEPESVFNLRTKWPAEALRDQGLIEIVQLPKQLPILEAPQGVLGDRPVVTGIKSLPDMDVMVLTRVLSERLCDVIPHLQRRGIKVVVDIDDDFMRTPPTMHHVEKINPARSPRYNWRHFQRAAKLADWMTCSTPALRSYRPEASTVLRNAVPSWFTTIRMDRKDFGGKHPIQTVGWSGSVRHHPGDLQTTHGGIARALEEANVRFRVVGDARDVGQAAGIEPAPLGTGLLSHQAYVIELARLDVLCVPLAKNAYTDAKSWITPLTASALGVYWIGAATSPEYRALYDLLLSTHESPSAALAAPRARDWRREVLKALRRPEDEREEAVEAARSYVKEHLTTEVRAEEWLAVWETVAARTSRTG